MDNQLYNQLESLREKYLVLNQQYLDLQNVLKDERQKTSTLEQSNAGLMQSVNNLEVENKRLNARNNMQQEEYAKIYRRMCLYAQELDELKPL